MRRLLDGVTLAPTQETFEECQEIRKHLRRLHSHCARRCCGNRAHKGGGFGPAGDFRQWIDDGRDGAGVVSAHLRLRLAKIFLESGASGYHRASIPAVQPAMTRFFPADFAWRLRPSAIVCKSSPRLSGGVVATPILAVTGGSGFPLCSNFMPRIRSRI